MDRTLQGLPSGRQTGRWQKGYPFGDPTTVRAKPQLKSRYGTRNARPASPRRVLRRRCGLERAGAVYFTPRASQGRVTSAVGVVHPLTPLQHQVLGHVANGCSNKEIAAFLGISLRAVKKHVENLMRRYGVTNRVALLRAAIEVGDVQIPQPQ